MQFANISLEQTIQAILQSGIVTQQEFTDYLDTFPPEKRPRDGQSLSLAMIRDGKLTQYQARMILEGKSPLLAWGEYLLLEKIGEGGMGQVFKAVHRRLNRLAAIKIIRTESLDSAEVVKRFYQEVRVASLLNHKNIVGIYEAGEQNNVHFLVMEYVNGLDLAALLKRCGALDAVRAVEYLLQVAYGLEYAHKKRILHRDIKPANLLLDATGTVKISDMGLARIMELGPASEGTTLDQRLTRQGQHLGTVDYMSPEQAVDARNCDHRTDIYSLGCTLFRLLTDKPVYLGNTLIEKMIAHAEAAIPNLRESLPHVPDQLNEVFVKMVAKRPEERYQSMTEVLADLRRCLEYLRTVPEAGIAPPAIAFSHEPGGKLQRHASATHRAVTEITTAFSKDSQTVRPTSSATDREVMASKPPERS